MTTQLELRETIELPPQDMTQSQEEVKSQTASSRSQLTALKNQIQVTVVTYLRKNVCNVAEYNHEHGNNRTEYAGRPRRDKTQGRISQKMCRTENEQQRKSHKRTVHRFLFLDIREYLFVSA